MDNAKRALYGVDEAFAEINKLRAGMKSELGALDDKYTDEINKLSVKLDTLGEKHDGDLTALNAEVGTLDTKLTDGLAVLREEVDGNKTEIIFSNGKDMSTVMSFGRYKVDGTAVGLIFCSSGSGYVIFRGAYIASGEPPYVFELPVGSSELVLTGGSRTNVRAVFIGNIIQTST